MAIIFQEKKSINWFGISIGIILITVVVAGVYYLFFAPTPKIDVLIPPEVQKTNELSGLEFSDPATIVNSQSYKNLRSYVGAPEPGALGRTNPFVPF